MRIDFASVDRELGSANPTARLCFSKLRFVPTLLKDRLKQEGLWDDLMQEIYLVAWEAWQKGLSKREVHQLTNKRVHAFLKACGYRVYRHGYYKPETPVSFISEDHELVEKVLVKRSPAPGFVRAADHLRETILDILRSNGGMSKRDLYARLQISARELDWHCAPLIKQHLVVEIERESTRGRPLTPLLVAVQPGQTLPPPKMGKAERIRQAYYQEGKGIKRIMREYHHSKRTVRKAIQRPLVTVAEREPVS